MSTLVAPATNPSPDQRLPSAADERPPLESSRVRWVRIAARAAAALVAAGGLLVLLGWQFDIQPLRAIGPVDVVMNPLAALLFVLTGSVLLLDGRQRSQVPSRRWGVVCGVVVAIAGTLVLMRPLSGWHVGVDDLLFRDKVLRVTPPDWMAENAALSFVLLGLALLSRGVPERGRRRLANWLVLPVALVALLVVIGYLYGAIGFITFHLKLPMALNTAFFFLAASFALVASRPDEGVTALFASDTAGGRLTRRLLPALLLVPLVLGWLIHLGMQTVGYGATEGLALLTLATIVLSALLTIAMAGELHRGELELRLAKDRAVRAREEAERAREEAERARAEAEHAREEAERANHAKSEFLSRMSHELRTPMNSILGFAQLLEMGELESAQKHSVERICAAGEHLLKLINEVLDLARIESDRLTLSVEPVRVAGLLSETLDLARPLAGQYGVRLSEEIPAEADFYIRADHQRITQVLLNLVSNAIKYNRVGGGVRFLCRVEHGSDGESQLSIGVRDDGHGIPPERMGELFTPFARLGAEASAIEGTGLGLSLSKGFVEAMGGRIRVESVPDVGSTFWVELPLAPSPKEAAVGSPPGCQVLAEEFSLQRPATVLYVEDNLANLDLIECILASFPAVRLIPALQGQLGLELAREHRPDLVLLDLHLPDIPGETVLQALRDDPRTSAIPVVIVSADATPGRIQRLREAGAREYLTKPLDVRRFLETVEQLLAERAGGSGAQREAAPDLELAAR
jgi:signal transduction histidine kinase/CheY-like chemotaxis protein